MRPGPALLIVGAFYVGQVIAGVLVAVIAVVYQVSAHGPSNTLAADAQRLAPIPAALVGVIAGGLASFLLTKRVLRGKDMQQGLAALGWTPARPREIAVGACIGASLAALYVVVLVRVFPPPPEQALGPLASAAQMGGWQRALWALLALTAAPVEEFVFRGVLWSGLRGSLGGVAAGLLVTAVFVGSHATEALGYWPAWTLIALVGVTTLVQRARTGSLLPAVAIHASYNAFLVASVYLGFA